MEAATPRADLLLLQSRMKQDPGGYEDELDLQRRHFKACVSVLELESPDDEKGNASMVSLGSDHAAAKELGDMAMFLAHVTPSYPKQLAGFPHELLRLLDNASARIPSSLRCQLAQALILLRNREKIGLVDVLPLMMKLQSSGDRALKKFIFSHLLQNISRMNRKHRNEAKNRALQNIVFPFLQEEDEVRAKHAFVLTCELYKRKVWIDSQTANAISNTCFHKSPRIMIAALKFLHGYENKKYDEDSDESDEDDDKPSGAVGVSKEAIYKANHKGTVSSKKKKQAKIERAVRSLKKQQRLKEQEEKKGSFAPLEQLRDPQEFAEKLFARLQTCNEKFQVKLMMIMVISRCVGMHQLLLLSFYPHLQRYVSPHQQDETQVLAAAVQACHDKVPVDVVEPLLKQLVNTFVHDRARPEVIAVGLNTVREICARIPLIMTKDLLDDLSMYKKSREKAVSAAANSIIGLYRQVNPSLLLKKHRGRGTDLSVEPKAFGRVTVHTDVPGIEFLAERDEEDEDEDENEDSGDEDGEGEESADEEDENEAEESEEDGDDVEGDEEEIEDEDEEDDEGEGDSDEDGNPNEDELEELKSGEKANLKRKKSDGEETNLDDMSLSQLKKFAAASKQQEEKIPTDGILSNEDFRRIRDIQAKRDAETALSSHGLRKFEAESQNQYPLDPSKLEANIRRKQSKEERIALSKAGRDERGTYISRAAVKKKKTGGLSNRQKEKKKNLPVAARRMKSARTREHRKSQARLTKNFRGRKAWK